MTVGMGTSSEWNVGPMSLGKSIGLFISSLYHELLAQYDFRPRVEPVQTQMHPAHVRSVGCSREQCGRLGYPKVIYYDDLGDWCSEPLGCDGELHITRVIVCDASCGQALARGGQGCQEPLSCDRDPPVTPG